MAVGEKIRRLPKIEREGREAKLGEGLFLFFIINKKRTKIMFVA